MMSVVRCEGCKTTREVELPWTVPKCACGAVHWKVMDPVITPGSKGMITEVRIDRAARPLGIESGIAIIENMRASGEVDDETAEEMRLRHLAEMYGLRSTSPRSGR